MEPTTFPQPATPLVVDVRSPGEFAAGHVDGAINLPLDRLGADCAQALPDKATPLVLCCLSGARSGMAAQWLRHSGCGNRATSRWPTAARWAMWRCSCSGPFAGAEAPPPCPLSRPFISPHYKEPT